MAVLRTAIAVIVLLLGLLAMLTGGVVSWSALREGEITTSYARAGNPTERTTVAKAKQPDAFWRQFGLVAVLPLVAGGLAAIGAWRALNSKR